MAGSKKEPDNATGRIGAVSALPKSGRSVAAILFSEIVPQGLGRSYMKVLTKILVGASFFLAMIVAIYYLLPVAIVYLHPHTAGLLNSGDSRVTDKREGRLITIRGAQEPNGNTNVANCFVYIGEPATEFLSCCFRPDRMNRTVTAKGTEEQWCYGQFCSTAFHFTNGVLTGFQEHQ